MRDFSLLPSSYILNSNPLVREAQNSFVSNSPTSPSPATSTSAAQASAEQQRRKEAPSMQLRLMRQLKTGPSNQSQQQRVPHSVTASTANLSVAELNRVDALNQALLAGFRLKADANPDNTPLTKDYCFDVLEEMAGWLKQQTTYGEMHSLTDLLDYAGNPPSFDNIVLNLEENFTNSGTAPVRMGKPNPPRGSGCANFIHIIEALNLSRRESHITLPPAAISRHEERLLHTLHRALVEQGWKYKTAGNNIAPLKHFCRWLQQQKLLGAQIPHGLDSLEKVLNHLNEQQVKDVVDNFRGDSGTTKTIGDQARTAINKLRNLRGLFALPVRGREGAQPTHRRLIPARSGQPANVAPPRTPSLGGPAVVAEASALPDAASDEAGSSRYGVWRPVPRSQHASRYVRPRPNPAQAEQLEQHRNPAPTRHASLSEPVINDEELALIAGPATTEEEFDFLNNLFK